MPLPLLAILPAIGAAAAKVGAGLAAGAKAAGGAVATGASKLGGALQSFGANDVVKTGLSNAMGNLPSTAAQVTVPGTLQTTQANYAQLPQSNGIQMQAYQSPQLNNYVNNLRRTY